jgi:S-adenosylhomocysteine hydrolase
LNAAMDGFETESLEEAARSSQVLLGCTGTTSIGRDAILSLPHNAVLGSASSRRVEIAVDQLEALASRSRHVAGVGTRYDIADKTIVLLADGYPINFFDSDSVENEAIDVIHSLLLEGAAYVCSIAGLAPSMYQGSEVIDEADIALLYMRLTRG